MIALVLPPPSQMAVSEVPGIEAPDAPPEEADQLAVVLVLASALPTQ